MNRIRHMLYQFMQGRRGIDQFGRFLLYTALILLVISLIFGKMQVLSTITYYAGVAALLYAYYRMLSRNLYRREFENSKFLSWEYQITKGKTFRQWLYERKAYAYFKCPGCQQKMRAPKGKGTIRVKCHNCNETFQKTV